MAPKKSELPDSEAHWTSSRWITVCQLRLPSIWPESGALHALQVASTTAELRRG